MHLTKQVKIYPTEEQVCVLWELSEKCRLIYNFALAERKDAWKTEKKNIKYVTQQNQLPELKKKYPEYGMVYSKVLQSVLKKLEADYQSFFALRRNGDKKARPPNFKSKNKLQTLIYNQSGFKIKNGKLTLSHKAGETPLEFEVGKEFDSLEIKQIEIYNKAPYKAKGDFFVSIVYEATPERQYFDNGLYQAFDAGITKIVTAVNSYGKFLEVKTPRPDRYWQPKIDAIKSRRDHCIGAKNGSKKSNRWLHLHITCKKMERKKSNQLRDFQHKLSKKLVENTRANTLIIGDLKVKKMAQSRKQKGKKKKALNRSTQNQGYLSHFIGFLTYKAELIGKRLIKIDEANTSIECYVCKKRHYMPLEKRILSCDCGNVIDRDRNSAINIMERFLSHNALWTGFRQFAGNLQQTGLQMGLRFLESKPNEVST